MGEEKRKMKRKKKTSEKKRVWNMPNLQYTYLANACSERQKQGITKDRNKILRITPKYYANLYNSKKKSTMNIHSYHSTRGNN